MPGHLVAVGPRPGVPRGVSEFLDGPAPGQSLRFFASQGLLHELQGFSGKLRAPPPCYARLRRWRHERAGQARVCDDVEPGSSQVSARGLVDALKVLLASGQRFFRYIFFWRCCGCSPLSLFVRASHQFPCLARFSALAGDRWP